MRCKIAVCFLTISRSAHQPIVHCDAGSKRKIPALRTLSCLFQTQFHKVPIGPYSHGEAGVRFTIFKIVGIPSLVFKMDLLQTSPHFLFRCRMHTVSTCFQLLRVPRFFNLCAFVLPIALSSQLGMDYGLDVSESRLREFQDKVTAQAVPIVESRRPELLPLDLQVELHLSSDRTSITCRKWLKELGLSFGTA